jgi:hypothetical protein
MTARERLVAALRPLQRALLLDRLNRMEAHYREVSTLDASETHRRISRAEHDDPGLRPYKKILRNGEDPQIAQQLLTLIANARKLLEHGTETFEIVSELMQVEWLNTKANGLLIGEHTKRGLKMLQSASTSYGSSSEKKKRDQLLANAYIKLRESHPTMSKRSARIAVARESGKSESTVKRSLQLFGITD